MRSKLSVLALVLAIPALGFAQGELTGTLTTADGPLGGATVVINEVAMAEITQPDGYYVLKGVPAGTYTVTFSLGDHLTTVNDVTITSGQATTLSETLDWDVSFAETITVYSASRRRERIVEAPAAVTVISELEIERESSHGQLPRLLEATPGAEITQSGLYDFNLNTRGFNSSLNRRVPVLVDGRDPSVPFLGSQDWPSLSSSVDLASAELVRGPSSALYGTNAFNGILNLTTKSPKFSRGGEFRLTAGELSTFRGDVRFATEVGENSYFKLMGSLTQSDDFYVSRNVAPEYSQFCTAGISSNCLRREAVATETNEDKISLANLRFDHYFGSGDALTVEGGYSTGDGPVLQTGIGRIQVLESNRPWLRLNYNSQHFNVLSYYNGRDAPDQLSLASGQNLVLDSTIVAAEVQANTGFSKGKGQLIGGVSYRDEDISTEGTLTANDVGGDRQAVFGQVEYSFTNRFKTVVAARYDDSSLHDAQVAPKIALVFAPSTNQTLRLTYNEAFQSPNYSEFFLRAAAGAPVPLASAALGAGPPASGLAPLLTQLGFEGTPVLALGNPNLELEEIATWEIGYSGILGGEFFLTADYYQSDLENFVTDLLPGVNSIFTPYQSPIALPPNVQAGLFGFLQAALGNNFVGLTNQANGSPAIVVSYANAGSAESQGVDLGLNWYVTPQWNVSASYSWFDFEVISQQLGDRLLPNSPENSYSVGVAYAGDSFDIGVTGRFVEAFDWAAGVFQGPIPSYEVFNLSANYHFNDHWSIGLNVANMLDDEHYEAFGGDLLGRRALGSVKFGW